MSKPKTRGVTFEHQDKLAKLPIPDLDQSCRQYLDSLRPLQSPREHAQTKEAVKQFLKNSGPQLQQKLIEYAESRASFIEQFWYDSYLNYDNPVVLNLNPFFLLEDDSTPYATTQVSRAATLTMSALRFARALRREELPPDQFKGDTLCMYQYSRLFGSARIPTSTGCVMQSFNASRHIVVICRSQYYWFDVLDDNGDLLLTEHDISLNFQTILEDAVKTPIIEACKGAVGVLTTENRRAWASIRESMMNDSDMPGTAESNNFECLRKVDLALFVVCLDHTAPENLSDLARNMLCGSSELEKGVQVGTCTNRWYDKLQIIVTRNAKAGINFEHTGVDGHTVLRFVSDIYTDTILRFAKSINGQSPSLWASQSPDPKTRDPSLFSTTPRKLEWVPTPELTLALRFGETRLADLIQQNEFQTLEFTNYGMNNIKRMGFSPDAFVQMGFQAAYYSLYGRVECTYEPAMTKRFLHGRTESIRVVSEESASFVRKFCEDAPAATKLEYLRRACKKHVGTTAQCSVGQGQDRHLYGLFCMWKRMVEEGETMQDDDSNSVTSGFSSASSGGTDALPPIFADAGWDLLGNVILSTSNCGNPALKLFGFGPTSADGFGLGYIIKGDSITICASSKHRQTSRFLDTLKSYFLEVRHLHKMTSAVETSSPDPYEKASASNGSATPLVAQRHFGRSLALPATKITANDEESSYLLGGYGYFDVGEFESSRSRAPSPAPSLSQKHHRRHREIGRKLRLAEY